MCFFTKKLKRKTARYDIPCFKIVLYREPNLVSLYRGFQYEIGENYSSKIVGILGNLENFFLNLQCLKEGFSSYNPEKVKILRKKSDSIHFEASSGKNSLIVPKKKSNYALMSCCIPFGATYYENEMGEFISDEITVLDYKLI